METIIQIPITKGDKKQIEQQAQALRLSVASYCRFLIFQNLNKKSSLENNGKNKR